MATGLNTGLIPTFGIKTANHGLENLEGFLTAVENPPKEGFLTPTLQTPEQENQSNLQSPSETERSGSVCVLIDKTNSTRVIEIECYKQWVSDHILKAANLALRPKVAALLKYANKLLE